MGELLNTPPYEQVGIQYLFIVDNTGLKTIIKPVNVLKDEHSDRMYLTMDTIS